MTHGALDGIREVATRTVRACAVAQTARRILLVLFGSIWVGPIAAQELEPRAYSASPIGTAYLLVGLSGASGSVATNTTVPIQDIDATRRIATAGAGYTFDLFGDVAMLTAAVPYGWTDVSGTVFGRPRAVTRSGLGDPRVRLSVNLRGNPAMGARAFARAPRRTIVGASVTVGAPIGQYERTKLVNVGTHRWTLKPEAGVSVPVGRWDLDAYAGVWIFGVNDEFYPGGFSRTQDPLLTAQAHASYTFRPRLWLAVNGTWYAGGEAQIEGRTAGQRMNNSRMGLTLSLPAGTNQSFKIAVGAGAFVRSGPDFTTLSVAWQRVWLTRE